MPTKNSARRFFLLSLLLFLLAASVAVSQVLRTPPQLYAELPRVITAGQAFTVLLSADRPVTYRVRYGDIELTEVTQDLPLELTGMLGTHPLEVTVTDSWRRSGDYVYELHALPELRPLVRAPDAVTPGAPLVLAVTWGLAPHEIAEVDMVLGAERLEPIRSPEEAIALAGIPLATEAEALTLTATLLDIYGRRESVSRTLAVTPEARAVQLLNMPESTLRVMSPENQALEEARLQDVYTAAESLPRWSEPFILPAQGRFTSPYGQPRRYVTGGSIAYHHGSDIAAPQGTPIVAANDGRVVLVDVLPIRGGLTVIDHGAGVHSLYLHQSRLLVEVGQEVRRGEKIGEVGTTGLSTGPHLHWEMRVHGVSTDPMRWVDRVWP